MSIGPLRRGSAVVGLIGLAPIGLQLSTGALRVETAAFRAAVVAVTVWAVGNLARVVLSALVRHVETTGATDADELPADHAAGVPDHA